MDECPFCGRAVPTELVVRGGTCPRCLTHIPGEEAPTDEGDAVAPTRRGRGRWGWLGFGGVLLVAGVLGGWATLRSDTEEELEPVAVEAFPIPDVVAVREVPEVAPSRQTPRKRRAPSSNRPARGATLELGLAGGRVRRDDNLVLRDDAAIDHMASERIREALPGLNACYERRLKRAPELAGRWRVQFEITPEGRARDVEVAALDGRDADLEGCLSRHIASRWSFARIASPRVVSRTLTFQPPR